MDFKSAMAILMLVIILGITAYVKKDKLEHASTWKIGIDIGNNLLKSIGGKSLEMKKPNPKIAISYTGTGELSGSGVANGVCSFYILSMEEIGNGVKAERWVSLNMSDAEFELGNGIHVSGTANWIELENGRVEKQINVDFSASAFNISGYGEISINRSSGALHAGDLSLNPESGMLKGFYGTLSYYGGNISISGKAERISAMKSGIEYDVS